MTLRDHLLAQDDGGREQARAALDARAGELDVLLRKYADTLVSDDQDRRLLREFAAASNEWRSAARRIMAVADAGRRDLHADLNMVIESNAIGRSAKSRGLPHIMQQRAPGQRHRTWRRQILQQQQRVYKHIALGMELWRLLHSLHRGNLRKHRIQQPARVEQQKGTSSAPFSQHPRQFIAHALA